MTEYLERSSCDVENLEKWCGHAREGVRRRLEADVDILAIIHLRGQTVGAKSSRDKQRHFREAGRLPSGPSWLPQNYVR